MGRDQDDLVLMPLRTLQRRVSGDQEVRSSTFRCRKVVRWSRPRPTSSDVLRERRHISRAEDNNFSVRDMREIASMLAGTTQVLTALLGSRGFGQPVSGRASAS